MIKVDQTRHFKELLCLNKSNIHTCVRSTLAQKKWPEKFARVALSQFWQDWPIDGCWQELSDRVEDAWCCGVLRLCDHSWQVSNRWRLARVLKVDGEQPGACCELCGVGGCDPQAVAEGSQSVTKLLPSPKPHLQVICSQILPFTFDTCLCQFEG